MKFKELVREFSWGRSPFNYFLNTEEGRQLVFTDERKVANGINGSEQEMSLPSLPNDLIKALGEFGKKSNEIGFFLIQNFPSVEDNILTGSIHDPKVKKLEFLFKRLAKVLGRPIVSQQKVDRNVIGHVFPKVIDADKQLSTGSVPLGFHSEDAFMDKLYDFVVLYCLRGGRTQTYVTPINWWQFPEGVLNDLMERKYLISPDGAFTSSTKTYEPKSVIEFDSKHNLIVRFDPLYTDFIDKGLKTSFEFLERYIDQNKIPIILEKGDLLIIDNKKTVHGRSSLSPIYNGYDRWLMRVNIIKN